MTGAATHLKARGVTLGNRLAPTDLDLAHGSLTVLVGVNGAGKTSLLHALARIGRPGGSVHVGGRRLDAMSATVRPYVLGYVPAARAFAWPLCVRDFVKLTAPSASREAVDTVLVDLSLADLADRRIDNLSTGERSRVLLARALLPRPGLLLLDEPFANLDPLWQLRLETRLKAEAAGGVTILVSVHDLNLAERLATRMLIVDGGRLVADAVPADLVADGTIARIFGVVRDDENVWREAD